MYVSDSITFCVGMKVVGVVQVILPALLLIGAQCSSEGTEVEETDDKTGEQIPLSIFRYWLLQIN